MQTPEPSVSVKVIVLGNSGVGKTSLANRECYNSFSAQIPQTIGTAHLKTLVPLGDTLVELKIWDTAGQEQFASLVPLYARGAEVCILVAALDDAKSLEDLDVWRERLYSSGEDPPIVVAINKCDIPGPEGRQDKIREQFSDTYPNMFFVSAKTGDGVKELFTAAASEAQKQTKANTAVVEEMPKPSDGKKCC